jgi:hypothetical protein
MRFVLSIMTAAAISAGSISLPRWQSCEPSEQVVRGQKAPDSVHVGEKTVPRTTAALKPLLPEPRNMLHAYPGERISIYLGTRHLGFAIYDGCQLVPEYANSDELPDMTRVTEFEMYGGPSLPAGYENREGYRVLRITKWSENPAAKSDSI